MTALKHALICTMLASAGMQYCRIYFAICLFLSLFALCEFYITKAFLYETMQTPE